VSRDEDEARTQFEDRYRAPGSDVTAMVEQRVIGAAWGANGYTTRSQADELLDHLALTPSDRLLDVGTGRGWPGLYLAHRAGCAVVGADLPFAALQSARRRAAQEGLDERTDLVVASGSRLPFRRRWFDAIVHTDVLC
jgi:ubiquinone/menaquinone biosynthesis C-methylase UbiE